MNLEPTVAYLGKFFDTHIDKFIMMRQDAGAPTHPEAYEGRHEAIRMIRDMVDGIMADFTDMTIPTAYASPYVLRQRLIAYLELARTQAVRTQALSSALDKAWPMEIDYAYEINNEVADAIEHALSLCHLQPVPRATMDKLLHIIYALPKISKQLARRRNDDKKPRPTLLIKDEYDVQDLLHSLLLIDFSDIRNEEWTPSFGGASKRVDFLLHDEKIVIEVKKVRDDQKQKHVVDELTIDIAAYQSHPSAEHLVCVVWDLGGRLLNPTALKKDLEKSSKGFATVVVLV
jgi:hypothetical protein